MAFPLVRVLTALTQPREAQNASPTCATTT